MNTGFIDHLSVVSILPALCIPLVLVLRKWAQSCWLTGPRRIKKQLVKGGINTPTIYFMSPTMKLKSFKCTKICYNNKFHVFQGHSGTHLNRR